jgi:ribosomal protein S6--L-glutamate ligase
MEAGEMRGHEMHFWTSKNATWTGCKTPEIHQRRKILNQFDAIIPRIRTEYHFYGCIDTTIWNLKSVLFEPSNAITQSRDIIFIATVIKSWCEIPTTGFANLLRYWWLDKMVGGLLLNRKITEGTQGKGVVLGRNKSCRKCINAFKAWMPIY